MWLRKSDASVVGAVAVACVAFNGPESVRCMVSTARSWAPVLAYAMGCMGWTGGVVCSTVIVPLALLMVSFGTGAQGWPTSTWYLMVSAMLLSCMSAMISAFYYAGLLLSDPPPSLSGFERGVGAYALLMGALFFPCGWAAWMQGKLHWVPEPATTDSPHKFSEATDLQYINAILAAHAQAAQTPSQGFAPDAMNDLFNSKRTSQAIKAGDIVIVQETFSTRHGREISQGTSAIVKRIDAGGDAVISVHGVSHDSVWANDVCKLKTLQSAFMSPSDVSEMPEAEVLMDESVGAAVPASEHDLPSDPSVPKPCDKPPWSRQDTSSSTRYTGSAPSWSRQNSDSDNEDTCVQDVPTNTEESPVDPGSPPGPDTQVGDVSKEALPQAEAVANTIYAFAEVVRAYKAEAAPVALAPLLADQ